MNTITLVHEKNPDITASKFGDFHRDNWAVFYKGIPVYRAILKREAPKYMELVYNAKNNVDKGITTTRVMTPQVSQYV